MSNIVLSLQILTDRRRPRKKNVKKNKEIKEILGFSFERLRLSEYYGREFQRVKELQMNRD